MKMLPVPTTPGGLVLLLVILAVQVLADREIIITLRPK